LPGRFCTNFTRAHPKKTNPRGLRGGALLAGGVERPAGQKNEKGRAHPHSGFKSYKKPQAKKLGGERIFS